jgi:hypothetical protein
MADHPIPMEEMAAASVPAAFDAFLTVDSPYGIDDLWIRNDTDGAIEIATDDGAITESLLLAGEAGFWPRLVKGEIVNIQYLAGSQPTSGSVRAGGFI